MKKGDTFRIPRNRIGEHPHIAITDPDEKGEFIVVANATDANGRGATLETNRLILKAGEHPLITKDSVICLSEVKKWNMKTVEEMEKKNLIEYSKPMQENRVNEIKNHLADHKLVAYEVRECLKRVRNKSLTVS